MKTKIVQYVSNKVSNRESYQKFLYSMLESESSRICFILIEFLRYCFSTFLLYKYLALIL